MQNPPAPWLKIDACEVCGTRLPPPLLDLGPQPLCDDLVAAGDARRCIEYPSQISLCPVCITAHHVARVRKETLFPRDYHYRARFTQDVLNGMRALVDECESYAGTIKGKVVCDIGCNDGSLLSFFRERGAKTIGIEPTDACLDARKAGHEVIQEYLSVAAARKVRSAAGVPDFVTFTNVFAHIESLNEAIESLKALLGPTTTLVIENHYLGAVIDRNQFDTFYHEHPRTYSFESFRHIAARLGGVIKRVSFPSRYGGNIRVFIGDFAENRKLGPIPPGAPDESGFAGALAAMQAGVDTWKRDSLRFIDATIRGKISVSGKSFPGRASILINLLGINEGLQPAIFEKPGSMKLQHYVPGTRIEIESDDLWIGGVRQPEAMIIWAWHIKDEVAAYVRKNGYRGRLFAPLPTFHEII